MHHGFWFIVTFKGPLCKIWLFKCPSFALPFQAGTKSYSDQPRYKVLLTGLFILHGGGPAPYVDIQGLF